MLPPEIDVACHNSASSSTISGPADLVKQFVSDLQKRKIFARAVNVANIAYHSRYIQPAAPFLLESLQKVSCVKKKKQRFTVKQCKQCDNIQHRKKSQYYENQTLKNY